MSAKRIRMAFIPRERFPTFRGRIDVLFGRELLSRGHEIDLIMQADNAKVAPGRQVWKGRSVYVGRTDPGGTFLSRLRKHLLGIQHDWISLRRADPRQYDSILVSDKFLTAGMALYICRRRGMKFFFWLTFPEHESQLLQARRRSARYPLAAWLRGYVSSRFLYRIIIPHSDHIFVQSPQMAANLAARGADPRKMTPILTGIDLADFPNLAVTKDFPKEGDFVVVYLGTLDEERRLEVLVEMLAILRNQGLPVRLLMVGDGSKESDRKLIERRARELGVELHLEITGFLPRKIALERVRAADVGISPFFPNSILEVASPTKLIEYMALGLPVIANDQPEQRLILRESRAGIRVPWHARHFARAVRYMMRCAQKKREQMGLQGRAWVEKNRTYSRIADDFERTIFFLHAAVR